LNFIKLGLRGWSLWHRGGLTSDFLFLRFDFGNLGNRFLTLDCTQGLNLLFFREWQKGYGNWFPEFLYLWGIGPGNKKGDV
jgi:hypothetical protein